MSFKKWDILFQFKPDIRKIILATAIFLVLCVSSRAKELKVNLVLDDGVLLIYSGLNDGMSVGDMLSVIRDGKEIGIVEIIEVGPAHSKAMISSQNAGIHEMHKVVRQDRSESVEPARIRVVEETPSPRPAENTADEQINRKPDKSGNGKRSNLDKPENNLKKHTVDEDTTNRAESSINAAPTLEDKKSMRSGSSTKSRRMATFASDSGPTGLLQIPTAYIASPNSGSISGYLYQDHASVSVREDLRYNYSEVVANTDTKANIFSLAYGVNKNLEISYAQQKVNSSTSFDVYSDSPVLLEILRSLLADVDLSVSAELSIFGMKYNPHQTLLFLPRELQPIEYAFGVLWKKNDSGNDGMQYYISASLPLRIVVLHANMYVVDGEPGSGGNRGYMAGMEIPIREKSLLIADLDRFRGFSTCSFGLRHSFNNNVQAMVGVIDTPDARYKMFNASYDF